MTTTPTLTWPMRAATGLSTDETDARGAATRHRAPVAADLTVIVPAHNAGSGLADTVHSLRGQTLVPAEIIVVDDCSTDSTPAVARALAVTVVRPPENTGSRAGAQNFALQFVETRYVVSVDADTVLARDAVARIRAAMGHPSVAAAFGSVLPRRVKSTWERGRYVENLLATGFHDQVRDFYGAPVDAQRHFAIYATEAVRAAGGWRERTVTPDVDLTWTLLRQGQRVRFAPEAVGYTPAPTGFRAMRDQLSRRSTGLVQNLAFHGRAAFAVPGLRLWLVAGLLDWAVAFSAYLVLLPLLALLVGQPWPLLGYVADLPFFAVPVLISAHRRHEVVRALASLPAFWLLRMLGLVMLALALGSALLRDRGGRESASEPLAESA